MLHKGLSYLYFKNTITYVFLRPFSEDTGKGLSKTDALHFKQVNYIVISLIWIAIAIGVVGAAVSNIFLSDILGFGLVRLKDRI